jgi:hypothetical protein
MALATLFEIEIALDALLLTTFKLMFTNGTLTSMLFIHIYVFLLFIGFWLITIGFPLQF